MKTTLTALLAVMLLTCISCNGCWKSIGPNDPGKIMTDSPVKHNTGKNTTMSDERDTIMNAFMISLLKVQDKAKACTFMPITDPKNNIAQYDFRLNNVKIHENDDWFLHKAFDAKAGLVCFVLAVRHNDGNDPEYFRGNVPCPKVCGLEDDLSLRLCLKAFLDKPINFISINKDEAQGLISGQIDGYVYTVPIMWGEALADLKEKQGLAGDVAANYCVIIFENPYDHSRPAAEASSLIPYNKLGKSYGYLWRVYDNGRLCTKETAMSPCELIP